MGRTQALRRAVESAHERLGPFARSSHRGSWLPLVRHPAIAVDELRRLERGYDLELPEAYARFLLEVGNGGLGPTHYPLFSVAFALESSPTATQRFRLEYPVTLVAAEHLETACEHLAHLGATQLERIVHDEAAQWADDLLRMPGCLFVGESGCGLDFYVVVDPRSLRRGEVWLSCDSGAACVGGDFLAWCERGLESQVATAQRERTALGGDRATNPEVVRRGAIEMLDRWAGLHQRLGPRFAGGAPLVWERAHAIACFEAAHAMLGDDHELLVAMAWSDAITGQGEPTERLAPLAPKGGSQHSLLLELTDWEVWSYADREQALEGLSAEA